LPTVLAGPPADAHQFLVSEERGIRIFYPARLTARPFENRIRITLKKFLFLKWLELEGARAIVSAPAEEQFQKNLT